MKKNRVQQKNRESVSNVATIDTVNPIPFEPSGQSNAFLFSNKNRGYLPFLEGQPNFFQLLLEAKLLSPTNNSCVNSKTNFCIGKGLYFKDEKQKDDEFIKFSKRVNNKGQSLNKVLKSIFNNHFSVGNNFVEIVRGSAGNKKFIRVINRSFLECRLSEPNDDDICESVFVSKHFRNRNHWTLDKDSMVEIPIYYGKDSKWYKNKNGNTEHCFIHIKNETPGYEYYGIPDNISSLPQQILEYKSARYNIDIVENNLVIGGIIFLDGNVSSEEAQKVGRNIIYSHTGDGKRGRWTIVTGKGVSKSVVTQFDGKTDGSFLKLDENIEGKIIDSNNWDSTLYGQHQNGGIS